MYKIGILVKFCTNPAHQGVFIKRGHECNGAQN
jgi:hypothetical protein